VNHACSRPGPLHTADVAAFLTVGAHADLTAWRVPPGSDAVEFFVHLGLRGDAVLAGGNANGLAW
jgi:hypothetical protein